MASEHEINTYSAGGPGAKEKIGNDEAVRVTAAAPSPGMDETDCEKYGAGRDSNPLPDLKRKLKSRHLQMIAIGTSNGNNLVLG
jgi:amino acid transporter